MTFTFKTTDVQANNVKHLRYVAKAFLRLASHLNSADNMHRCTMRSNKVLKSLQILCFWRRYLYVAMV